MTYKPFGVAPIFATSLLFKRTQSGEDCSFALAPRKRKLKRNLVEVLRKNQIVICNRVTKRIDTGDGAFLMELEVLF